MEKYYTEQGINKNLVWFQLMLQSLKTGQIKHIIYRYGINCIQKERQGKELDEKEKSVHVLLNTNIFFVR